MPTRVLLSVKPRFAEAILAGLKTFEFRRAIFRRTDIKTVVLYASSPTCKVVGEFTIESEGLLSLRDVYSREYDAMGVDAGRVHVTVWADDLSEPGEVTLLVGHS